LPGGKSPDGAARRAFDQLHLADWGAITLGEVLRHLLLELLRGGREVGRHAGAKSQAEDCASKQG
jgi:hypothetical protein